MENNAFYDVGSHQESYLTMRPASKEIVVGYNAEGMSDGRAPGTRGSQAPYPHDLWAINPGFVNAAARDLASAKITVGRRRNHLEGSDDRFCRSSPPAGA